jgi:hypothetical protein
LPIYVTYASRRFVPPKMRVVVDFLASELGQEPALAIGPAAAAQHTPAKG